MMDCGIPGTADVLVRHGHRRECGMRNAERGIKNSRSRRGALRPGSPRPFIARVPAYDIPQSTFLGIPHCSVFRNPQSAIRIRYSRRGFTLIELLVALTIATFIMSSAAVVFVTMMDNWNRGAREQRLAQAAQTTADLIEKYLRCAVPPGRVYGSFTGEDLSTEDVDGHRLTFYSTAEGRFPRAVNRTDISEIEFAYDPNTDSVMTMRIDATPDADPAGGGMRVQLSNYLIAFRVMYFDGFEWAAEWYDDILPLAVEFHLIVGDPEDTTPEGETRTREISRLVWLPMGKARPEEETSERDPGQPSANDAQGAQGGMPGQGMPGTQGMQGSQMPPPSEGRYRQ